MADRKITDLTALAAGSQATGDLLTIVDVSEGAAVDKNKKIAVGDLLQGIPFNVGIGITTPGTHLVVQQNNIHDPNFHEDDDAAILIKNSASGSGGKSIIKLDNEAALVYGDGSSNLIFSDLSNERLRINSSGNIGIGTTSPSQKLHVNGTAYVADDHIRLLLDSGNGRLQIRSSSDTTNVDLFGSNGQAYFAGNVGIGTSSPRGLVHLHSSSAPRLDFTNTATGTGSGDGATISVDGSTGALNIIQRESQPIQFYTGNTERLRLLSGGGLTFNGDTAAANALDDYEEGTWTASLNTVNNNATISHGNQTGYYVKVGSMVHAYYYTESTTVTSAGTSSAVLNGLPFTVANLTSGYAVATVTHTNIFTGQVQNGYAGPNQTRIVFVGEGNTSSMTFRVASNKYLMVGLTYRAA